MMDREYLQDKIHRLTHKPWITEGDLLSLYTILVALPLSDGNLSHILASLAQDIDGDLKTLYVKEDKQDAGNNR